MGVFGNVPNGYVEVPYLKSNGTQYIDLGVTISTSSWGIKWTMMVDSLPNTYHTPIGSRTSHNSSDAFYLGIHSDGHTYGCIGGNKLDPLGWTVTLGTKYTCELKYDTGLKVTPDGGSTTTYSMPYTTSATTRKLCAFALYENTGSTSSYIEKFTGKIYNIQILKYSSSSSYQCMYEFVPCMRLVDGHLGLYDVVNKNFYVRTNGNAFTTSLSEAINAKSFCNYIVSKCKYFDNTEFSSENKTQLYDFLMEGLESNPSQLININTGFRILNKLYKVLAFTSSNLSPAPSVQASISALSYNTAKELLDTYIPESTGYRSKFCRLNQIYESAGNLNSYNFMYFNFYLVAKSSFTSPSLAGILIGGGGGGSGGQSHDGDKNSNFYTKGGGGAKGGDSQISIDGTVKYTAQGGNGAAAWDAGPCGGNPDWHAHGSAGTAGSQTAVSINIPINSTLQIYPGYGGGGGGGFGCSCSNSNDYRSWAVDTWGVNAVQCKGGNGAERSTFTGEDEVFGGGGGEGGHGTRYSTTGIGSSNGSGPANWGTRRAATYQSNGKGGKGGYTDGGGGNDDQPNTLGAAGYGGKGRNQVNDSSVGNGGNGGNCGGFKISSSCTASTALFIFDQTQPQ